MITTASRKKVSIDNFASEIQKILKEYSDDVSLGVSEATIETAKLGAQVVNRSAAGQFGGRKYRRSWTFEVEGRRYRTGAVIYSKMPGLPHLLEKSHKVGKHGHYSGRVHIAPVEQQIVNSYTQKIEKVIVKG